MLRKNRMPPHQRTSNDSSARRLRGAPALCLALAVAASSPAVSAADDAAPRDVRGASPDSSAGGAYAVAEHGEHLSPQFRQRAWNEIRANARRLKLAAAPRSASARSLGGFAWPMALNNGLADPGYHAISNYVDQAGGGQVLDYSCGARSYDGHRGTDYYLWPFSWYKMDNNQVKVIAAAAGTIVGRYDGNFDRSCSVNNNNWNAVYVQHADGSVAWYGHMKNGSVTAKGVGANVAQGEYLGLVGSSGSSTEPHLHFEVYDANANLIDPYAGSCNGLNLASAWAAQRPYYDSAINKLIVGNVQPAFASCPNAESPNENTALRYGQQASFSAFYRDQLNGQQSQYRILRPNGTVFASWTHNGPAPHYASSWWNWTWSSFAPTGPAGIWRFEVAYNGTTYSKTFTLSP